jgi:hypothetical protein
MIAGLMQTLVYINYKHLKAKKMKQFLYLSEQGTKNDLSFSSQEMVGNKIIGLDGIKRKLLLLDETDGQTHLHTIDLGEIESCTIKKNYNGIYAGELKKRKIEEFINSIVLQFDFKNASRKPIILPFYDKAVNNAWEIKELETKARGWQTMLSKLLIKQHKKRA